MTKYKVFRYSPDMKREWDQCVLKSSDGTFLFMRDFMEYHKSRFEDYSLMLYSGSDLVAIFPANINDEVVYSHQGLTYGGLLFNNNITNDEVTIILRTLLDYLKYRGVNSIKIKALPEFYQVSNTKNFVSALKLLSSEVYRSDMVLAIDYNKPFSIHKTKLKHFRRNQNKGFEIKVETEFKPFWDTVLEPRLRDKHNTSPVHSASEIHLLKQLFPNKIKLYGIYLSDKLLAGIVIFDKGKIVKSQYGATTEEGAKERALEFLFVHLIFKFKEERKSYFSMGTVRDQSKKEGYNDGLLKQKMELGCEVYKQDFYNIALV